MSALTLDSSKDYRAVVDTSKGQITFDLFTDKHRLRSTILSSLQLTAGMIRILSIELFRILSLKQVIPVQPV
jgi:hypothetical protein